MQGGLSSTESAWAMTARGALTPVHMSGFSVALGASYWKNCFPIRLLCINFRNPPHFVLIWPLMVAIQTACKNYFIRCNKRSTDGSYY